MKIFIASSEKHVGKVQEDIYIRDAYISEGLFSEISTLQEITKSTKPSDVVILKSIWGYHTNYKKFLSEIFKLKESAVKLINNYDFIFWNINKHKYLIDIRKYVDIIPTNLLKINSAHKESEIISIIAETSEDFDTDTLVIKPSIAASGYLTSKYYLNKKNVEVIALLQANKHLDFIVQPYRPSISQGEISVIVINGKPVYGVTRFPGTLEEKRGTKYLKLENIPDSIKTKLSKLEAYFLRNFGNIPNICRIDFISTGSTHEVGEIELIDPDLFFRHIPESVRKKTISMFIAMVTT